MHAAAVVLAGGSGTRVGAAGNKVYLPVAGRRLISWSLLAFAAVPEVVRLVLVVRPEDRPLAEEILASEVAPAVDGAVGRAVELVTGGRARHDSEHQAVMHLAPAIRAGALDVIAIHDGARPVITPGLVTDIIAAAHRHGGAIPGVPLRDTAVADPTSGPVPIPVDRTVVRVQTPQAFRAAALLSAYEHAATSGFTGTDTAACVESYTDVPVHCLPGDPRNIKVTYPADLTVVAHLLTHRPAEATRR